MEFWTFNLFSHIGGAWGRDATSDSRAEEMVNNGLIHLESNYSVDETLKRLQLLLQEKSVMIFALVDHSGEAAKVGLQMRPTKVLIFGSPKGGTPVMVASPTAAIDLPLKALIFEDEQGKVWLS